MEVENSIIYENENRGSNLSIQKLRLYEKKLCSNARLELPLENRSAFVTPSAIELPDKTK